MTAERILITSGLPYANGHIHLGHLVEYTQTDIFARYNRMIGRRTLYVCGDDTHGTAIMIRARQEGRSELEVIRDMSDAHQRDFADFQIKFDHYGSTHSPENQAFANEIWEKMREQNHVIEREVTQLFDPKEGVFLADRFVKGTCPVCATPDQYGDNCEKCGSTYSPTELKNPTSTLSGATPEVRSAKHLFVAIEPMRAMLTGWTQSGEHLQKEIANYLMGHFLGEPLRDWDVSRPAPYFGFEIPDAPGNFFYVWFDAPIGYLAATKAWCDRAGESVDTWWRSRNTEIVHVIGKDIVYFHTLFWPAMLHVGGFSLPSRVQVHGFLTVNGEKMSKRRGTFILGRTYLEHLDPAALRYYYASKLTSKVDDIDLSLEELVLKVNGELVNKVVNLASRCSRFLKTTGFSPAYPEDGGLFARAVDAGAEIGAAYASFDFAKATRVIMSLADRANEYLEKNQPWVLAKDPTRAEEVRAICSVGLNLYRQLAIYLAPVLPKLQADSAELLGSTLDTWDDSKTPLIGTPVGEYKHLMKRVEAEAVNRMIEATKALHESSEDAASPAPATEDDGDALAKEPIAAECSIDDFSKIDLRVVRVIAADAIPEAKKLLKLTVSLGGGVTRTIFAGIKAHYRPEDLIGKLVVICANLAPRQMKFGLSEGMVLAAGDGSSVHVLHPDSGAKPGMRIH
jgi:methionyl-tRNA synthetase